MSESIIVALITGVVTVIGVMLTNSKTAAITANELKHLADEVQMHNNFARRMPVVEEQIKALMERINDLERRMENDKS